MSMDDVIREKIEAAIAPDSLEVINQSHLHAGHAGDDGSGESHYKLIVVWKGFEEYNRIERHRLVYDALGSELTAKIHAIQIICSIPE